MADDECTTNMTMVNVRLDPEHIEALDGLVERYRSNTPEELQRHVSRSTILRKLIVEAAEVAKKEDRA